MWLRRVYFLHSACLFSVFLVGLYQCLVGDIENEARFFVRRKRASTRRRIERQECAMSKIFDNIETKFEEGLHAISGSGDHTWLLKVGNMSLMSP